MTIFRSEDRIPPGRVMDSLACFGRRFLAVGCLLLGIAGYGIAAETSLQLFTEDYPPLTFERDGEIGGGGTEIVREIMRRAGLTATIHLVPWSRGYATTLRQENTGLFVTALTKEREPLFKWVGPIASTRGQLYALKGGDLKVTSLAQAGRVRHIAVPRDWYLHEILVNAGLNNVHAVANPHQALRMLDAGRVDLVALNDVNVEPMARAVGLDPERFEAVFRVSESPKYIAFSMKTSDSIVNACRKALAGMMADGTVARIYQQSLPGLIPPARLDR
ncbi:MAG: transporter substrate-binding domain-containing protein [Propionivibrio sp.]